MALRVAVVAVLVAILAAFASAAAPPTAPALNPMCMKNVLELTQRTYPNWAMMLLAATGKTIPMDAGNYDLCRQYDNTRFFLARFSGTLAGERTVGGLGLCLPHTCNDNDIAEGILMEVVPMFKSMNASLQLTSVTSPELDIDREFGAGTYFAIVFFSMLLALIILATLVDYQRTAIHRHGTKSINDAGEEKLPLITDDDADARAKAKKEAEARYASRGMRLLLAFSVLDNLPRLLAPAGANQFGMLNGMRVISMAWVVLGHSVMQVLGLVGFQNLDNFARATKEWYFQFVLGAEYSVDTFFFISGFLVAYMLLKELREKDGRVSWVMFYVHRYWRLIPCISVVILFYFKLSYYMGSGPFWYIYQNEVESKCPHSWWAHLLFVNDNIYPYDPNKVCMAWLWYVADDMIFYILSPLYVIAYRKHRKIGWFLILATVASSFGVTAWLIEKYNLDIYVFGPKYDAFMYHVYSKAWTRIPSYVVGIGAAFIVADKDIYRRPSKGILGLLTHPYLLFVLAVGGMNAIVFAPYSTYRNPVPEHQWTQTQYTAYMTVSHFAWCLCMAILTIGCAAGRYGFVNWFLSLGLWTPLTRLTYGAYLVHPIIIKVVACNANQYSQYSFLSMAYWTGGNLLASFVVSAILFLAIERPFVAIEGILLKRQSRRA
eukprot:Opistho-1_new@75809